MQSTQSHTIEQWAAQYPNDVFCIDYNQRVLYSQDIFTRAEVAAGVVRPRTADELVSLVQEAVQRGYALFPRGGGVSYTRGYVPNNENSLIFDLQKLNRIIEINAQDMYVTVEAGCTWKSLYEELSKRGLRTPFWGSLSGLHATVGGSVSQNAIFWGAAGFGGSSDSVLGLSVLTGEGKIIKTGAGAHRGSAPFTRYYGPDLTGLFCCDCGALGIKTEITLRLIVERDHHQHLSFEFSHYAPLIKAMNRLAQREIAAQMFATDPGLADARSKRESLIKDIKSLKNVVSGKGRLASRMREGARIAANGRSALSTQNYSLHISIEQLNAESTKALVQEAAAICHAEGGAPLPASVPTLLRANPFGPLNNALGPKGERWVPVHGILPLSNAEPCMDAINEVFTRYAPKMAAEDITTGFLLTTVNNNEFVIEPLWFWPDAIEAIHCEIVEASVRKRHTRFAPNPRARDVVDAMRLELKQVFRQHGATHLQIGRAYGYSETLDSNTLALLKAIKKSVDPCDLMNPGCLGL